MNTKKTLTKLENLSEEFRRACCNSIRYEGVSVTYYICQNQIYFSMYTLSLGSRIQAMDETTITFKELESKTIMEIVNEFKQEVLR